MLRVKVAAALAVGVASFGLWRIRKSGARSLSTDRERAMAGVAAAGLLGLGWWVLIGIMTQAGFSGNDRYLVLGAALINIAGGVGWGWAALAVGARVGGSQLTRARHLRGAATMWSAVGVLAVCFALIPG